MNASALAVRLAGPSGFASIMKGMFGGGKAKQAQAIWRSARQKGVYDLTELRFVTHEAVGYAVMAFTTAGRLAEPVQESLAAQAEQLPAGTIRGESRMYSALMPIGRQPHVDVLGEAHPGALVFVTVTSPKGSNRPLVAHCVVDGRDYIYPVPGDRLR